MGVCCIVFDIDGMLFEFFMNFLNIEKKKNLRFFFSKFHVFFTFHAISNIKKKKIDVKKNSGGGGVDFFLEKLISRGAEGPGREILQRPPSVRLSVCLSVRPSVRPSVCLSVCPSRLVFAL